jgi:16S rRNA (guanine966-N2)-methyltransferase
MRVVAGTLRGRRIVAPEGRATRPTSDKVRGAVFNALMSLDVVRDAAVVDLFAGSGALGIEALSRGASRCTFVEQARPALGALRANIATLDLKDRAEIVDGDAMRFVARRPGPYDLVLADPPYTFTGWPALFETLQAEFLVVESGRAVEPPERWVTVRERAYGGTVVTFLRPAG